MSIQRIQITNLGAIESFDAPDMPPVVLVQGGNGAGKSSFLDALKYLADSGHDPDIIHGNAAEGEIIVTFSDGNQVMARATRKGTTRGWKPKDGGRWILNRQLIDSICKAISYDPLSFLRLTEQQQALKLLEIAPIEVAPSEIITALGAADAELVALTLKPDQNGLEIIDATYDCLYKARTPLNTGADVQEAHALELERALPPAAPDGTDWSQEAVRLQAAKSAAETAEGMALQDLRKEFDANKELVTSQAYKAEKAIEVEIDAKIAALERERTERTKAVTSKLAADVEYARGLANAAAAKIKADHKPRIEAATAELATATERARAQQQGEGTRKAAQVAKQEASVKRERARVITEALERLKALKVTAAGRLKIPGVSVLGGRIMREENGAMVPLAKWNTEGQLMFCLRLGVMANGAANFVMIDNAEHLEDGKLESVIATMKRKAALPGGMQFIIASVTSGPLTVKGA